MPEVYKYATYVECGNDRLFTFTNQPKPTLQVSRRNVTPPVPLLAEEERKTLKNDKADFEAFRTETLAQMETIRKKLEVRSASH